MNKKNMLLKLHNADNNAIVGVNKKMVFAIISNRTSDNKLRSKIYLYSYCQISPFEVNEVPSFIIQQGDEDFITLHDADNNEVIIINKDSISIVDTVLKPYKNPKAKIYFDRCCSEKKSSIIVNESAEKIINEINKNDEKH